MKISGFILQLTFATCFFFSCITVNAQQKSKPHMYTVKPGDYLLKIAVEYGSPNFWKLIYEENKEKIDDPDLIYIGQKFTIPSSVTGSNRFVNNTTPADTIDSASAKTTSKDQQILEKFRTAFEQLINQETKKEKEAANQNKENYNNDGLEFGGLVINQTRSKMGKDFFDVFYQYWQAPDGAGNFMLTVTEQPVPSLGTLVIVKIDSQPIYKSRLQPRYNVIEKLAKQAVAVSYRSLQQQISNSNELTTY